jgi:hypothetical protein
MFYKKGQFLVLKNALYLKMDVVFIK